MRGVHVFLVQKGLLHDMQYVGSLVGILLQTELHEILGLLLDGRGELMGLDLEVYYFLNDLELVTSHKGSGSCEHFVHGASQTPYVRVPLLSLSIQHFWSNPAKRAFHGII